MNDLQKLAKLVRYYSLFSTTQAGSGHPSSSLSSADLMTVLFFKYLRFDLANPDNPNNDRVIFSKGHASPLFYALYTAAGAISKDELATMRQFTSVLEGHPTPRFRYTEAATGSLGQGLSVGVGMALAQKQVFSMQYLVSSTQKKSEKNILNTKYKILDTNPCVYVLLGDGEMAEGSVWEAIAIGAHYKLSNLVGILDVNRLAQSDATMYGHDVDTYEKRISAFGWNTIVIDGHNLEEIDSAFQNTTNYKQQTANAPTMIIAKTIKGKGVSFIEDKDGWHGKALKSEEFEKAVAEIGEIDLSMKGKIQKPESGNSVQRRASSVQKESESRNYTLAASRYTLGDIVATRQAYGQALAKFGAVYPNVVALDADVKNSTFSELFKKAYPDRFFDMYIAEQNMVGASIGFARLGFIPFVSTFAAFFTRAYDQIRMSALSNGNIKLVGSHAGVSIGEDGASQMGLEDFAMFRAVCGSVVLHPADAVATEKLVEQMIAHKGLVYMRTSRPATPVIYSETETFAIGGSKVHKSKSVQRRASRDALVIIATGVTVHEALKAQEQLKIQGIAVDVIDCYSIKPIDGKTLVKAAQESRALIIVEDHWEQGGLGDAVRSVFDGQTPPPIYHLSVSKMPRSGKPEELLAYEGIDAKNIIKKIKSLL